MAIEILWIDGFDEISVHGEKYKGTSETDSPPKYTYSSKFGITPPFGYGRFIVIDSGYLSKTPLGGPYSTIFSSFHMRAGRDVGSYANHTIYFETWADVAAAVQCAIKLKLNQSTGTFDATFVRGTTDVYTWQTPIRFGQWHHMSLMFFVDPYVGKVRLAVDGNELVPFTGNTRGLSSSSFNRFRIRAFGPFYIGFLVDDWIVATGLPTDPLLPPARVYGALMPNANVEVSWSPNTGTNWQCVDEIPVNYDADYNYSPPSGSPDVFSHAAIPNLGTDVLAVKVNCVSRKTTSYTESVQPLIRVSGTDYYGTAQQQTNNYFGYWQLWQNNPATGLPWTPTDAQSAGFGYRKP